MRRFQLGLAALLLCGCAGKLDQPKRFSAVLARLDGGAPAAAAGGAGAPAGDAGPAIGEPPACATQIFQKTCGLAGCHAAGSPQVDLASAGVAARLVDRKSTSATCGGRTYIDTSGGASLLLGKLGSSPPCGVQMPFGGVLSATDTKCLSDWVQALGGSAAAPSDGGMQ